MTNEYKLAPSVPTPEMSVEGVKEMSVHYPEHINPTSAVIIAQPKHVYTAMLKDAPTLQEVDLHAIILAELNEYDLNGGNHYLANMLNKRIKQKHSKLYAVKGEG